MERIPPKASSRRVKSVQVDAAEGEKKAKTQVKAGPSAVKPVGLKVNRSRPLEPTSSNAHRAAKQSSPLPRSSDRIAILSQPKINRAASQSDRPNLAQKRSPEPIRRPVERSSVGQAAKPVGSKVSRERNLKPTHSNAHQAAQRPSHLSPSKDRIAILSQPRVIRVAPPTDEPSLAQKQHGLTRLHRLGDGLIRAKPISNLQVLSAADLQIHSATERTEHAAQLTQPKTVPARRSPVKSVRAETMQPKAEPAVRMPGKESEGDEEPAEKPSIDREKLESFLEGLAIVDHSSDGEVEEQKRFKFFPEAHYPGIKLFKCQKEKFTLYSDNLPCGQSSARDKANEGELVEVFKLATFFCRTQTNLAFLGLGGGSKGRRVRGLHKVSGFIEKWENKPKTG